MPEACLVLVDSSTESKLIDQAEICYLGNIVIVDLESREEVRWADYAWIIGIVE